MPEWIFDEHKRNELIQAGCIKALAASAGFAFSYPDIDYGLDVSLHPCTWNTIRKKYEHEIDTMLSLQLKTTINWDYSSDGSHIRYALRSANYNSMVSRNIKAQENQIKPWVPLILVLMCLPKNGTQQLSQTRFSTVFKRANFWYILDRREIDYLSEESAKTIYIPTKNMLTVTSLKQLMNRAYDNWQEGGASNDSNAESIGD